MGTENNKKLILMERIFAIGAIVCFGLVAVWSLTSGPWFLFMMATLMISIPGLLGGVFLLDWATIKAIRSTKEDRRSFFRLDINPLAFGAFVILLPILAYCIYLLVG